MEEHYKTLNYNVLTHNEINNIQAIWQNDFAHLINESNSPNYNIDNYFKTNSIAYLALQEADNLAKELTIEDEADYEAIINKINEILYPTLSSHKLLSHAILALHIEADISYNKVDNLLSSATYEQLALLCLAYTKNGLKELYVVYMHYLSLVFKQSLTHDLITIYLKFLAVLAFNFNTEQTNALYRELQYIYYRYQDEAYHSLWCEDETVQLEAIAIEPRLAPFYEQIEKSDRMIAKQLDLFN